MATRFYFDFNIVNPISPAVDAGWNVTTVNRACLVPKTFANSPRITTLSAGSNPTSNVTNASTQNIIDLQFISPPIPPQNITGTVSFVMLMTESVTTANCTLALVVRILSQDGNTVRGTLFSVFGTDTEFATTAATRIVNAQAVTSVTTQPGDRLVVEIGGTATSPTTNGTLTNTFKDNGASDFALTSGLTTALNPWIELSQNIYDRTSNNFQFVSAGNGMSTSEKIR